MKWHQLTIGMGQYSVGEPTPGRWMAYKKTDGIPDGTFYTIFPETKVCSCPAWQFGTRPCKHVWAILRLIHDQQEKERVIPMSGFRKAKAEQAALKMSIYGPPGSGKTFTTLLIAEGLASITGQRIAYVDTERGTDFYCQTVGARKIHPEPFDFDALYTKSLTEVSREVRALDAETYGVIVIDSISHLWDAAKSAYSGPLTKIGTIPLHAWGKIKAPYKELMAYLLNCPMHVFILGRQANEFIEDDDTGETKAAGVKMRAEGETAYEPHICLRMELAKATKRTEAVPIAFAEKDRTGILSGKYIRWPDFHNIAVPLLGLLGNKQAAVPSDEDASVQDAEELAQQDREKAGRSAETREQFKARLVLAKTKSDTEAIGKEITSGLKRTLLPQDVKALRDAYLAALNRFHANGRKPQMVADADRSGGSINLDEIPDALPV